MASVVTVFPFFRLMATEMGIISGVFEVSPWSRLTDGVNVVVTRFLWIYRKISISHCGSFTKEGCSRCSLLPRIRQASQIVFVNHFRPIILVCLFQIVDGQESLVDPDQSAISLGNC